MLVIINAMKSITRSKGRNILIGIIVLVIAASSCVALAISNAAAEAEVSAAEQAAADEISARLTAEQDLADKQAELETTKEGLKSNLSITGSISIDRQKMMEEMRNSGNQDRNAMRDMQSQSQELSLDELQKYADSEYVKDFFYTASISLNATGDLEAYGSEDSGSSDTSSNSGATMPGGQGGMGGMDGGGRQGGFAMGGMAMGDFNVTGYMVASSMTKFKNETAKITSGKMIDVSSSDMNCLISDEVSVFNSLSVGDKITLSNPSKDDETYTFTIVGIYTDSSSAETGNTPMFATAQDPANLICISYSALQKITANSTSVATTGTNAMGTSTTTALSGQISHFYVFSGLEDYESFGKELVTKGLSETYTLSSTDLSDYNRQINEIENNMTQLEETISNFNYTERLVPIQNLSKFAGTMFWVILAIGALILIVINVFNIRERKYEVGVLTAIGIKKGKVAMQFVTELMCITMIAIVLGSGLGAFASVPVADYLLSDRIEQMQEATEQEKAEAEAAASDAAAQNGNNNRFPGGAQMPDGAQGRENWGRNGTNIMSTLQDEEVDYINKITANFNFAILGYLICIGIVLTVISSLAAIVFVMRYEPLKILANRA